MKVFSYLFAAAVAVSASSAFAQTGDDKATSSTAPPVPTTREAMKELLEKSKQNKPRLPLPPLTEEEQAKIKTRDNGVKGLGGVVNNGRMRQYYLPKEFSGAGFTREPDAAMTLGYPFQTMCFWIVSRCNNCVYCMGHQESKLAGVGLPEEKIAALDSDWSQYDEKERAAFAFVKKLTLEPWKINDEDVSRLSAFYKDNEILEIVLVTGNFNAMNRWTGSLRIPQEEHRVYLSPTPDPFKNRPSLVAPQVDKAGKDGVLFCASPAHRPALESSDVVKAALQKARGRTSRIELVSEEDARKVLPEGYVWGSGPLPQYVRLLARFPKAGGARIALHKASEERGAVDPKLRAQIAYVAARNDRAWYALGAAIDRLKDLGQSELEIQSLDGDLKGMSQKDLSVLALARKLTVDPALIEDADVEAVRKHMSDREVAEVIHHVTEAAGFDRITEAAGLPLDR